MKGGQNWRSRYLQNNSASLHKWRFTRDKHENSRFKPLPAENLSRRGPLFPRPLVPPVACSHIISESGNLKVLKEGRTGVPFEVYFNIFGRRGRQSLKQAFPFSPSSRRLCEKFRLGKRGRSGLSHVSASHCVERGEGRF